MGRGHACNLAPETNPGNLLLVMSLRPGLSPPLFLLLGIMTGLGSVVGAWSSAVRWEREVRDQNDAALARTAVAYIGVVTPSGPEGGVDARRLVAAAHTIAGASFWPGGFQMAIGSVALVADTIGLVPLPDSAAQALERGEQRVITTHARFRAVLVPLPSGAGQRARGWAAAWNTLPPVLTSRLTSLLTVFATLGLGAALLILRHRHVRVGRRRALLATLGALSFLILSLGLSVRQAAKHSTAVQLRMARRLIEIAATAAGVRQARLPEIAANLEVRTLESPALSTDAVERKVEGGRRIARVIAATPRSRGGLEIRMTPVEAGLGRLWGMLLLWLGIGAVGMGAAGSAAGLSAAGGLFHSTGPEVERPMPQGHLPE
jgi:antitoxin (DNA-binding transcriptional repressor) of toxin-antitoxin stability system